MEMDKYFPKWDFRERHRTRVRAPRATVMAAVNDLTWDEVPVFRMLLAARMLGKNPKDGTGTIIGDFLGGAYEELSHSSTELMVGAIMKTLGGKGEPPVVAAAGGSFREFEEPGYAKIAFNFRHSPGVLTTETRVRCTDFPARAAFAVYWAAIRLPSSLVRRDWLAAIRRRAERTG